MRVVLSVALAVFLVRHVIIRNEVDLLGELRASITWLIAMACVLYPVVIVVSVIRWKLLLDVQGVHLTFRKLLTLTMIGNFFSTVLPGSVTGDVIKMFYVSQQAEDRRAEAVLTIFMDRVCGLCGLLLVTAVAVMCTLDSVGQAGNLVQAAVATVGIISVAGIAAFLAIVFHKSLLRLPGIAGIICWGRQRLAARVVAIIERLMAALHLYPAKWKVAVLAVLLSVFIQTLVVAIVFSIGKGVHEQQARLSSYFLGVNVANIVCVIPVTPGGLGTRDIIVSEILKADGAAAKKSGVIPAFFSVIVVCGNLLGGIFFVFHHGRSRIVADAADGQSIDGPLPRADPGTPRTEQ